MPISTAPIKKVTRELYGLGVYRALAQFALTVCALRAFPDHPWVVVLAILVFSLALAGAIEYQRLLFVTTNHIADLAERKTRYTIVVAQEWALRGEAADGFGFWDEVNHRVSDETGEDAPGPAWWNALGLIALNTVGRFLGDAAVIALALVFAGAL